MCDVNFKIENGRYKMAVQIQIRNGGPIRFVDKFGVNVTLIYEKKERERNVRCVGTCPILKNVQSLSSSKKGRLAVSPEVAKMFLRSATGQKR